MKKVYYTEYYLFFIKNVIYDKNNDDIHYQKFYRNYDNNYNVHSLTYKNYYKSGFIKNYYDNLYENCYIESPVSHYLYVNVEVMQDLYLEEGSVEYNSIYDLLKNKKFINSISKMVL